MFDGLTLTGIIVFFVSILIAMSFHEAMHAFTAHWLGDTTAHDLGRVSLNPLKHIDIITTVLLPVVLVALGLPPFFIAKPVPFNPYRVKYGEFGAALIGVAGPLTNLLLAFSAAGVLRLTGAAVGTGLYDIIAIFLQINVALFVFNMIPFPPLDGSRLLYAFAPEPIQRAMMRIESLGFSGILIFMFLLFPFLGPVVIELNRVIVTFLMG